MIGLFNVVLEGIKRAFRSTIYFIKHNLKNASKSLLFALPFIMYYLGILFGTSKKGIVVWIIVPLICFVICAMLNWIAKSYGNKEDIPFPKKRFTKVDEDGEVTIETKRLQELIIWMSEFEDWLERKGIK